MGKGAENHIPLIVKMITSILDTTDDHRLKLETYDLSFHSVSLVRETFSFLHFRDGRPQCFLAACYVQKFLQKFGFHLDTNQGVFGIKPVKHCLWYDLECIFAQKKSRLLALIPKHTCMATKLDLHVCNQNHLDENKVGLRSKERQDIERARRQRLNFDLLVKLNSGSRCKQILQVYTYQHKPFPFCLTEDIKEERLLQFLLSHRHSQQWLSRSTLLGVLKDITEALLFLKQNDIVQRDITSYNMGVLDAKGGQDRSPTDVLPSQHFTVKLLDLGLAHNTSNPTYQYESAVKGKEIQHKFSVHEVVVTGLTQVKTDI